MDETPIHQMYEMLSLAAHKHVQTHHGYRGGKWKQLGWHAPSPIPGLIYHHEATWTCTSYWAHAVPSCPNAALVLTPGQGDIFLTLTFRAEESSTQGAVLAVLALLHCHVGTCTGLGCFTYWVKFQTQIPEFHTLIVCLIYGYYIGLWWWNQPVTCIFVILQ